MNGNGTLGLARALSAGADLTREIDELLRRRLGVGELNAETVAAGLTRLYPNDAQRIEQETRGLSINGEYGVVAAPSVAVSDSAGTRELRRVRDALSQDLDVLVNAPANREWKPELQGWRSMMLRTLDEGAMAATNAQDPAKRDAAFLAVRTLGSYARVARMVGVTHLQMNFEYRRLARSLDEAAGAIRVLCGESLYDAGLADGGIILSVPLTDLRQRGEVLVAALRGLLGLEQVGEDDTGQNLHGYGALLRSLDAWGESELAMYLREPMMRSAIDTMLETVSAALGRTDADALRELSATLPITIRRFRRLADVAADLLDSATPGGGMGEAARLTRTTSSALERFRQALELFVQALDRSRSGARLIDLGVPLAVSVLQTGEADGTIRLALRQLVSLRAEFAAEADEYVSWVGSQLDDLRTQVRIDMLLQHIDRAIDLYATGGTTIDRPNEDLSVQRAAVVGIMAQNLLDQAPPPGAGAFRYPPQPPAPRTAPAPPVGARLEPTGSSNGFGPDGWPTPRLVALTRSIVDLLFANAPPGDRPNNQAGGGHPSTNTADRDGFPGWRDGTAGTREMVPERLDAIVDAEMDRANREEEQWQGLAVTLAPRTTRGSRYGRSLLLAGWDLLAYNSDRNAYRRPARPVPAPPTVLSTLRETNNTLSQRLPATPPDLTPLTTAVGALSADVRTQTSAVIGVGTAVSEVNAAVTAQSTSIQEVARQLQPVSPTLEGLSRFFMSFATTAPGALLPAVTLRDVRIILDVAQVALDQARAAAGPAGEWNVDNVRAAWGPWGELLLSGGERSSGGSRPARNGRPSLPSLIRGWQEGPADSWLKFEVSSASEELGASISRLLEASGFTEADLDSRGEDLDAARSALFRLELNEALSRASIL